MNKEPFHSHSLRESADVGPFVLAAIELNEQGWPVYVFGARPYVHRGVNGAEQEARRLARTNNQEYALFGKMYSVVPADEILKSAVVSVDELAACIARGLFANNQFLTLVTARKIVEAALAEVELTGAPDATAG